jgi:hypothetical protein
VPPDCWSIPEVADDAASADAWLEAVLARNAGCSYLRRYGSPRTLAEFREQLPVVRYEDLLPSIERIATGERDVLFAGGPVAFERTGGSAGGSKLIPYSAEGLADFRRNLLPWLAHTVRRHRISGSAYFAISPVARAPERINGIPVGLVDSAYLGDDVGRILAVKTAVPFAVAAIADIEAWRRTTLEHLRAARDLELISVWSPTFLLRLLEGIGDTRRLWPKLKVVSCWTAGPSARYAQALAALLPQARIEAKGLLSTEAVVTVPDAECRPVLAKHGYVEFIDGEGVVTADEIAIGSEYEVVVTTASGLYRYATGDRVRCAGRGEDHRPILEFVGRDTLCSDLVGEKLTDTFVGDCLKALDCPALLVPDTGKTGYVLVCEHEVDGGVLDHLERQLARNPQYAYARRLGQLAPLRALVHLRPFDVVEETIRQRGVRLGDIKPTSLRREDFWLQLFETEQ